MIKKMLSAIACIMAAALVLTGCRGTETAEVPMALAVVIGNHGSSEGLNFLNIKKNVTDAVRSNGYISVISVDGEPELLAENLYEIPAEYANANKSKLEADALVKANRILAEMESVMADDPECDYLTALWLAVRSLSNTGEMEKIIIVVGTGFNTDGDMNFINNLIAIDPEYLAEALYQRSAIPNFENITVIWYQMGDVAAPQKKLTEAQRQRLTEIWRAVIEKTGGTFILQEAPYNPSAGHSYPYVTPVSLPEETPIICGVSTVEEKAAEETDLFTEPQFLSEEQVKFIADSDQYIDAEQAVKVIAPIAGYMNKHPGFQLLLIGTTAGDETTEFSASLSKARANTVKATLVSLGVPEDDVLTLGLGSDDPWHIYGAGTGDDPLAGANRKVVLLDAESATAAELLAKGGDFKGKL